MNKAVEQWAYEIECDINSGGGIMWQKTYNFIFASRNKLSGWINVNAEKYNAELIQQIVDRREQLDTYLCRLNRGTPSNEEMQRMTDDAQEFLGMCGLQ